MKQMWLSDLGTACKYFDMIEKISEDFKRELTVDEKEYVFAEFAKAKNIKFLGNTELTKIEIIKEALSKNHENILNIDEKGYTFIKKKKENK